jgi:Uma2 family endonuclease
MSTISAQGSSGQRSWTVAGLYRRFGPILFSRIRHDPPPGSGTVDDVVRLNDHEDRLYELVDGILVEKTVGLLESWIAMRIGRLLGNFADPRNLGFVTGEGGTVQLDLGLVRIPDVSFISNDRMPGGRIPTEPVPLVVPDLVVEVISKWNTRKEMEEKLDEYFEKGVGLVWIVRPQLRVVDVYQRRDRFTRLTVSSQLDGGEVLAGFAVAVSELFPPGETEFPQKGTAKRPRGDRGPKKSGAQPRKRNGPRKR